MSAPVGDPPGPVPLRLLHSSVIALLLLAPAVAWTRPLPPGLEPEVMRLAAGRDDAPLPPGWTIRGLSIGANAVEIVLRRGDHELPIALRAKDAAGAGTRLGETASFAAWLPDDTDAEDRIAAEALLARVRANDAGTFWARADELGAGSERARPDAGPAPTVEAPAPPTDDSVQEARTLGWVDDTRRVATWALLLAAVAYVLARMVRLRQAAAPALIFVLALALRLGLPPHAPIHTNDHGIAELRGLVSTGASATRPVESDRYGVAFRQAIRIMTAPFGGTAAAVLRTNALLGALATLPMAAAGALLFQTPFAGLVAAFAVALAPTLVVLSPTESAMPLAMLLFLLGVAGGLVAIDPSRPRPLRTAAGLLAGAALANASELGVTTLLFPLAALLVLAASPHRRGLVSLRIMGVPGVVVLVAVGLHALALSDVLAFAAETRRQDLSLLQKLLSPNLLLRDPRLVSPALLPLFGLGVAVLAWQRRFALAAGLVASFGILLFSGLIVLAARSDAIRYQGPAQLVLMLGLGALVTLRRPAPMTVALVGVLAATSLPGLEAARRRSLDAAAYERVSSFDDAGSLVVRVARHRMGEVLADFPEYAIGSKSGRIQVLELPAFPEGDDRSCRAWLGPACYRFTEEEVRTDVLTRAPRLGGCALRPECAPLSAGVPADAEVAEVPWIDREFFVVSCARPIVGLFPCETPGP